MTKIYKTSTTSIYTRVPETTYREVSFDACQTHNVSPFCLFARAATILHCEFLSLLSGNITYLKKSNPIVALEKGYRLK